MTTPHAHDADTTRPDACASITFRTSFDV